jgi:hypothetical protein
MFNKILGHKKTILVTVIGITVIFGTVAAVFIATNDNIKTALASSQAKAIAAIDSYRTCLNTFTKCV